MAIEAPESLRAVVGRIQGLDAGRLQAVMRLVGLRDPGNRIRVVLVPEESRIARDTAPWVAAFADAPHDLIVLFPDRIGSYPHDSLEVVLHHEVAHILTARAAGGGRLPRWFDEGLASVAERTWGIGNRSRFLWATVVAGRPTVTALEGLFYSDARGAARAYIISHAIVRDVIRRHGAPVVPRILSGVAAGKTFDLAFIDATGTTVRGATRLFWRSSGGWEEVDHVPGQPVHALDADHEPGPGRHLAAPPAPRRAAAALGGRGGGRRGSLEEHRGDYRLH